jgi:Flp pilus assembly protein TadG
VKLRTASAGARTRSGKCRMRQGNRYGSRHGNRHVNDGGIRRSNRWGSRGSSAVELAILAPLLIFMSMLIIQFALWFDARHAALAAAQEGDRIARETAFTNADTWEGIADGDAMNYYHALDTSALTNVSAAASYAADNSVAVTVTGKMNGIWPLTISETVSGPVECFRTEVSQGAECG